MKKGIFRVVIIGAILVILSNILVFGIALQVEYIKTYGWRVFYMMIILTIYLFALIFSDMFKKQCSNQ